MDDENILTEEESTSGENETPAGDDPPAPTPEPIDPMLAALKVDLGISSSAYDERLSARIEAAKQRIADVGITLNDTAADNDLVLMYAAWLWRSRASGEDKPLMLRSALYNRLFGEKARTS